jgi:protein TonB
MLIVVPKIAALFGNDIAITPPITDKDKIVQIFQPPPIEKPQQPVTPPPSPEPPAPQTSANNIQVTDQPTDTEVTPNEAVVTTSTEQGTGPAVEYTGPTVVAPPAEPVTVSPPPVFLTAEVMPRFDGMVEFLSKKLKYPASARRMGITGKAFVEFVVSADGTITNVKLLKGFHPDCDKEALRVVSMMPAWSPGMQNHIPVAVRMVVPITFAMRE